MEHKIKLVKETACLMLTENGKYLDSVFFNKYDLDNRNIDMKQIEFEANKLACIYSLIDYSLDVSEFK